MPRRHYEGQKSLGQAIRNLRQRAGLSLKALGQRAGIHPDQITRIEKGHVDPTWANVGRIAEGLGVSRTKLAEEEARIEGRAGLPPCPRVRLNEVDVGVLFGQNVLRLRQSSGLSQRRLAKRCGISVRTVGSIERGSSLPRLDIALRLAASLDAPPGELFEGLPEWVPDEGGEGKSRCLI